MKNELNKKLLSVWIKFNQKIMYKKAKKYGFTHPYVVAHSQSLDVLLNKYQKLSETPPLHKYPRTILSNHPH
ncbi:aspartyl-phosphate phosphatase Spo0E family protein [Sporosarcina sp. G11-34]|uniref:aspartyl-phosphate phosphatase Spo0E family protein n=1 Tax=Sporosarcina sp. G11-34 TaxID=2849605 RepID=UPI002E7A3BB5|nr:aspartyl-phosphate phosphatase Spo0E family protein [Sporosarcina sp. G11-34]